MPSFNPVLTQNTTGENSTVVAEFIPKYSKETQYQSEAELEKSFIEQLQSQAYEYLNIKRSEDLVSNLRKQLEKLNQITFSAGEWDRFFNDKIANPNKNIADKTHIIQDDFVQILDKDDRTTKNIYLIDKKNIHNNTLQVINQYEVDPETSAGTSSQDGRKNRYDVTILVNGLPLVHIELKSRGVDIREAFNQIERYKRESFWADSGLYEYIQLFVISNGTFTKYYSNTTRDQHIKDMEKASKPTAKNQTSHSFEFTSWWADRRNKPIYDLRGFTQTFFTKHTLLNIITKYCVFDSDRKLLVMRPYQICATESILQKIETSLNYKKLGSVDAGGYIWHTTGSGKTLTSFKTACLASERDDIKKVLFVVDRKDLDYQTMKEYDRFQKDAANSNTSTSILTKQLSDPSPDKKIIITTIQKLDKFIKSNSGHTVFNNNIVIIFDECHRSQFGDMHNSITKAFKNYFLFGFTGTPIFTANASSSSKPNLKTTEQAFGTQLHSYTIVDAINDKNVLPFRVDYVKTAHTNEYIRDEKVRGINTEAVLQDPIRITSITKYILEHFTSKTIGDGKYFDYSKHLNINEIANAKEPSKIIENKQSVKTRGFNSIFAVSSIESARLYYNEFKRLQKDLPDAQKLKVATIFSYSANEEVDDFGSDGIDDEDNESTVNLDKSSRDFLDNAIKDYNKMFQTNYDTSSDKFPNYYKDLSMRVKNKEVDILIVVNMFLTGFDATTLNTLWVDKNLRQHGLLQAFSRTNRILNSVKTFGMIVCFRDLEEETNKAIALFGDKDANGIVLLRSYPEYYDGYDQDGKKVDGYKDLIAELSSKYPIADDGVSELLSGEEKKDFIKLYGAILRLQNILNTFDEFDEDGQKILSDRDFQDYKSMYLRLYDEFRRTEDSEKVLVNDDIVFEMELIKQVDINIDYILNLIKVHHIDHTKDKEIRNDISRAVNSSADLHNKKDLIELFIDNLNPSADIDESWQVFMRNKFEVELEDLIKTENLDDNKTKELVKSSFEQGFLDDSGIAISQIMPPISRFTVSQTGENDRAIKRNKVERKLRMFFDRFFPVISA